MNLLKTNKQLLLKDIPSCTFFIYKNQLHYKTSYFSESGVRECFNLVTGKLLLVEDDEQLSYVTLVDYLENNIPYVPFPIAFHTVDVIAINKSSVLLGRKPKQDKWQFVGGFVEPTHTAEHTAAKEFSEEAGILISDESRFKYLMSLYIDDARYKDSCHKITTSVFIINLSDSEASAVKAGDDLEEVKWVSFKDVYNILRDQHKEIFVKLLITFLP